MKRFAFIFMLAALVAPVLLGLLSGTAAEAAPPIFKNASVNILHNAPLTTGGVNVTVNYSCAAGITTTGELFVAVIQGTNFGESPAPATCDGKQHLATVFVAGTFSTGAANVEGEVDNDNGSAFAQQNASISIKG